MPLKYHLITLFLILLVSLCSGQIDLPPCKKASQIVETLSRYHINPPIINDTWSDWVFNEYIYLLDPGKRYFSIEDILDLDEYKTKLDDAIKDIDCSLIDKSRELFKKKLAQSSLLISTILKTPFDYSTSESLPIGSKKSSSRAAKQSDLENYWRSSLKLQVLFWMSRHSEDDLAKLTAEQFKTLEASARKIIQLKEQGAINRLQDPTEGFDHYVEAIFLKAIAHSFDPHTEYFSKAQKEDFDKSLSTEGLSFGVELEEDQYGQIKISRLTPGGPAWASNELNQGDIVTSVAWSAQEPIDIEQYDLEELNRDLGSTSKNEVTLTVKKVSNQIKTIQLTKGKIELEANVIRSFMLKGEKTIGYISLPGFYSEFENQQSKGCADDMARELIKLKKEKIDGLILDLRFNGGGSLWEAISLAGIFIDVGPLALIQETGQPVVTLKDLNRGTIYDGPLVIMVNGFSASASELVSAVLQDFNRALVVGKQTYGKATGQVVIPINKNSPEKSGFLKVTNDRIYRVTGKSLQKKGVVPDIVLPDLFDSFIEREMDFSNAIGSDSVIKKVYYTPLPALPIPELKTKSTQRLIASNKFEQIIKAENVFTMPIPLELKEFDKYNHQIGDFMKSVKDREAGNNLYQVQLNHFDDPLLSIDSHRKEISEELLKEIQHSPYIGESYRILLDYISIIKIK